MPTRLIELIGKLPGAHVVLVGDLMLDRYLYGNAGRISPEAPVPVLHYQNEELRLGGAANVAADLAVLGANLRVVGAIGRDEPGQKLRKLLREIHADDAGVVECDRATTTKLRLVGSAQHRHPQQMLRMDFEDNSAFDSALCDKLFEHVRLALEGADVLCIEDYNKGLFTPELCQRIIQYARTKTIPVLVDPAKHRDYSRYRGATSLKLNRPEAEMATGLAANSSDEYRAVANALLESLDLETVILTLDKAGAYLGGQEREHKHIAGKARQVFDVTGAGDMVLAALAMARAAGATWEEAVALANLAGGLEVEKFGVVPITRDELLQEALTEAREHLGKERDLPDLLDELAQHRAAGRKIVFTNGCFDLIHLGHVKYFQFAKAQGDILVVAINTDAGIRRLKGPKRPIVGEDDRLSVLEELISIDYLVRFEEDTPIELINRVRPDVLVKGADYTREQVVGYDVVESYGGHVALAPLIDGRSTSSVIQRILEAYK